MRLNPSEKEIQHSILELLRLEGIYALRINTGSAWANGRPISHHSGGKGIADIIAFPVVTMWPWGAERTFKVMDLNNQPTKIPTVLWIEVKSPKGRQTPEQKSFEQHAIEMGQHYLLARSLEDILAWLREHR
jgi:hypothetical protein